MLLTAEFMPPSLLDDSSNEVGASGPFGWARLTEEASQLGPKGEICMFPNKGGREVRAC
jgi:hypothetical protein